MEWLTYSLLPICFLGWLLLTWAETRRQSRYRQQQEMLQARRRMSLRRLSQWDETPGPSRPKR